MEEFIDLIQFVNDNIKKLSVADLGDVLSFIKRMIEKLEVNHFDTLVGMLNSIKPAKRCLVKQGGVVHVIDHGLMLKALDGRHISLYRSGLVDRMTLKKRILELANEKIRTLFSNDCGGTERHVCFNSMPEFEEIKMPLGPNLPEHAREYNKIINYNKVNPTVNDVELCYIQVHFDGFLTYDGRIESISFVDLDKMEVCNVRGNDLLDKHHSNGNKIPRPNIKMAIFHCIRCLCNFPCAVNIDRLLVLGLTHSILCNRKIDYVNPSPEGCLEVRRFENLAGKLIDGIKVTYDGIREEDNSIALRYAGGVIFRPKNTLVSLLELRNFIAEENDKSIDYVLTDEQLIKLLHYNDVSMIGRTSSLLREYYRDVHSILNASTEKHFEIN